MYSGMKLYYTIYKCDDVLKSWSTQHHEVSTK
jgi:hypothetical protein